MRITLFIIALSLLVLTDCRKVETAKPDIVIPRYVEKRVTVAWESVPTYVGMLFLPYGGEVSFIQELLMSFIRLQDIVFN